MECKSLFNDPLLHVEGIAYTSTSLKRDSPKNGQTLSAPAA